MAENSQSDEQSWLTAGTGWEAYQEALAELKFEVAAGEVLFPDAEDIVALAKLELEQGNTVTVEDASPVYLRDTVAWKKLPGRE